MRGQRGQSLVLVVLTMGVMLAFAAVAIDVASWYAKHHQAQVSADAAALAAANCLAAAGTSGNACTSTTDTADAQTVAESVAKANGITLTSADIHFSDKSVSITAHNSGRSYFASLFGIQRGVQTARATATWTPPTGGPCGTPGAGCDFMFAANADCSSSTNGISFAVGGNTNVQGNIQSNGNISGSTNGTPVLGTGSYGPGACSDSLTYKGQSPWTSPPTQAASTYPYPLDYTPDFPSCGGAGELACAPSGYPTFCTETDTNYTSLDPVSGNIYCASGSGEVSNPATWDGTITIKANGTNTWYDSFVAGSITLPKLAGNNTLSSCGYAASGYTSTTCGASVPTPTTPNYPIFYAIGTSATALNITAAGGQTLNGDLFAPNGTASLSMTGNKTLVTFIEAKNISATINGDFMGDGPTGGGSSGLTPGSDSLIK